jgi:flagellar export protein FliJ
VPFRYQLQKVLDLMETREKSLEADVLAAQQRFNIEQDKLDEINTRKTAAQKGLSGQMASGATTDVKANNDYIQMLDLRLEAQYKSLSSFQKELDAAIDKQMAARRERQKIEKHKEMKFDIFKLEQKKKDAQRIDEMAGTIFMKKRAQNEESAREDGERLEKMEKLRLLRELREKRESKW